ncbi:hypothetical protein T265_04891 [Opisthorchis viverrini]|uniref:SKP1 component POZ domain-containing protein n=1 Tax=Opisthorchis viverrini TaxID=6198 RepID=A0A074ZY41_OPIVI|nr:hypothetical protein T265_04891 [Opisthorchis viverrini]KER28215.1 hypothetical protein T265_04891 [Opisthorchis viverrini]
MTEVQAQPSSASEQKYGGAEGADAMYVKLVSSDDHEFYVRREYALISGTIKAMLSGPEVQAQPSSASEQKYGGAEGADAMYVKLVSSDDHEFYVRREYALISGTIKAMLSGPASARPSSVTTLNTSKSVFKPRKPVYLATFNVRTLKQAGQQVAFARTLDSLCIDVCCLSETRTQYASVVIKQTAPSLSYRFRLRTSGDAKAAVAGYAGIPVDSRLCAGRLATLVRESRGSEVHRTLFIVSAYAPTACSSESGRDSFYDALDALQQQAKSSDIVVVAGDMNAQVKVNVRADQGAWWIRKAQEMEDAKNTGDVRKLFHLIRSTDPRKPLVSEIIRDQNGSLKCSKAERLACWAQYFEQ